MRPRILIVLLLALGLGAHRAHAQKTAAPVVVAEHRYLFDYQGMMSNLVEKQLIEALRGIDAEIVVAIDRPANALKLVARFPLSVPEVTAAVQQFGVSVVPHRPDPATQEGALDHQH